MGAVLSRHFEETLEARTETKRVRVYLNGGLWRWVKSVNPHVRYVFRMIEEETLTVEEETSQRPRKEQ